MTLYPGAAWVPVPGQEKRALRRKGRGVGYHVAVYEGPSLQKIDAGTGNDSHLYVRFDGSVEQNVDLDRISYAMVDGNATMVTVETEGGVAHPEQGVTAENQPWTDAQVSALARILRWAHDTEGVPLQLMSDSRPASRGAGWHKQGVNPWRVPGGETWSTSYGKTCPGAAKIAQVPLIVQQAQSGDDDDMTPDQALLLSKIADAVGEMRGELQNVTPAVGRLEVDMYQLMHQQGAPVDPAALASALAPLLTASLSPTAPVSQAELEAALRSVLGSLNDQSAAPASS